jgi:putative selenium metabolism hydrolase
MNHQIASMAESMKDDLVSFLRDIIAIPSVSGNEEQVINRMKQEMEKIGYHKVWIDPMGNLLGQIGSGDRILVFDGHCDTVAPGNPDNWHMDPYKGEYRDGIIYGRGAADQKGGLASAIYAGKILMALDVPDDLSFIVVASILEEDYEGLCWKYIIEKDRIIPQAVVLTEPTDMTIKIGQRGRMEIKLKVNGVSCHGSTPEMGDNAIYKITPIVRDIKRLNRELTGDSILGKGSIVVTDIRSEAPSLCAVPDSATIHLDRRMTAGENMESSLDEITRLASVDTSNSELSIPEYAVKSYTGLIAREKAYVPIWLMEESHPLVQTAIKAYHLQFNKDPDIGVWHFSTNGVTTKGVYDIPSIGFGPGKEEHAHAPDEQVKIEDLVNAMSFYASFALHWIQEKD